MECTAAAWASSARNYGTYTGTDTSDDVVARTRHEYVSSDARRGLRAVYSTRAAELPPSPSPVPFMWPSALRVNEPLLSENGDMPRLPPRPDVGPARLCLMPHAK